jgi:hypothetical protein
MKKKSILLVLFTGILMPILNAQNKPAVVMTSKVEVYYFHPSERCPIDQAIEENTRQTMLGYFSNEIKNGTIKFQVLNTDDKANSKTISKFDINAQALYLVKIFNGKEIQTDLTSFAFDYGKSNPQKFKMRLRDEIERALK